MRGRTCKPVRRSRGPVADPCCLECGHAGVEFSCSLDDARSHGRARALAQTHAQVDDRPQAELFEQEAVRRLGREMSRHAVRNGIRAQRPEHGRRRARHIAVDDHGDALQARRQYGACHGSQFTPAKPAQHLKRIAQMRTMKIDRAAHGIGLALKSCSVDTGAGANPVFRRTAKQRQREGRRDGCVADPHLTDAENVTPLRCLHAIGHGGRAFGLFEGRPESDVLGGFLERQFEYLEAQSEGLADLVHRRATGLEIGHHLPRDLLGVGSDSLVDDTVIAGEDCHHDARHPRRVMSLPGAQPFSQLFQPPQRTRRLGQLRLARPAGGNRIGVSLRQILEQVADIVKGQARSGICHLLRRLLFSRSIHHRGKGLAHIMSDGFEPRSVHRGRFRPFAEFLVALRFLTRLPAPFIRTVDPPRLKDAMAMFPVVGLITGGLTAGALILAHELRLPDLFCGFLAIGFGLLLTGAFHEDGLADLADGFGGGTTREDRLRIMKDSHIGAYGTLALVVTIPARAALLAGLLNLPPLAILVLMAGAAAFSRALMVDLLSSTRPARNDGLAVQAGQPSRQTGLLAIVVGGLAAGLGAWSVLSWQVAVISLIAALLAIATIRALAMRKIGGQTGDVCGAGQVMAETAMLAVFVAALSFR
jgi:adenosylcobinamide-GDP ribazoletransferase